MDHHAKIDRKSEFVAQAHINAEQYQRMYRESIEQPDVFWAEQAKQFHWFSPWSKVKNTSFEGDISIRWFEGGKTNLCYNCIDRHLPTRANHTAIIWEGDAPGDVRRISYGELSEQVNKLANVLKHLGVQKGDRVTIYMPMVPEAAIAMLACARIGAIHSVIFGGFSPESIRGRMEDCQSDFVITADEGVRGGKKVPLKANVDAACATNPNVRHVLVFQRERIASPHPNPLPEGEGITGAPVNWVGGRDIWWHEEMAKASADCPAAQLDAEDPLFILYTSGSTGKPKGALHTTGGYMVYAGLTAKYVFDLKPDDIFWCTADVGWVTGHSYTVYGALLNGVTTLMFEGVPSYPDASRFWQVVDAHKVSVFYTAPTAIRALMREGEAWVEKTSRQSLRLLGSVGEPINPEAWLWYYRVVGGERCPIVDTWWQTETGGHMITPLAGAMDLKPGAASLPFFGVKPVITDSTGKVQEGAEAAGLLCFSDSWPGQMRTVYGDHARFKQTYFSQVPGYYFSGDGCVRDEDGYYWITGRVDDVLNVSGHRIGTAEVESALIEHHAVAESAVVGCPHDIKGQAIYAYVILKEGVQATDTLAGELRQMVRKEIGPFASPDYIQFTSGLPKTRSGKIMRRILRKIAELQDDQLGDISTLTNPEIIQEIIMNRAI